MREKEAERVRSTRTRGTTRCPLVSNRKWHLLMQNPFRLVVCTINHCRCRDPLKNTPKKAQTRKFIRRFDHKGAREGAAGNGCRRRGTNGVEGNLERAEPLSLSKTVRDGNKLQKNKYIYIYFFLCQKEKNTDILLNTENNCQVFDPWFTKRHRQDRYR